MMHMVDCIALRAGMVRPVRPVPVWLAMGHIFEDFNRVSVLFSCCRMGNTSQSFASIWDL
jgi:hypothetical protein